MLRKDGKIAFANATVRAAKADADFWLSKENLDKAPDAMKDFFKGAQAMINPYIAAGKFKAFDGETELVPGIKAIPVSTTAPTMNTYNGLFQLAFDNGGLGDIVSATIAVNSSQKRNLTATYAAA